MIYRLEIPLSEGLDPQWGKFPTGKTAEEDSVWVKFRRERFLRGKIRLRKCSVGKILRRMIRPGKFFREKIPPKKIPRGEIQFAGKIPVRGGVRGEGFCGWKPLGGDAS